MRDGENFVEGRIEDTRDGCHDRLAGSVALAQADLGSGHAARDACTAAMLSTKLGWFMAPGGVVASDQELYLPQADPVPLPPDVQAGRYFPYRWRGAAGRGGRGPAAHRAFQPQNYRVCRGRLVPGTR